MAHQIDLIQRDCADSCANLTHLDVLKNQVILITGGTGFMGKWITEMVSYLNENFKFDIKLYLLARNIEKFKVEYPHLAKKKFIHFLEQDIRNLYELPSDVNWVINAAGTPDSKEHSSQPIKTIETFTKGTTALFESCYRLPDLKKILHISSHEVYGKFHESSIQENEFSGFNPNSLNSIYAESKRLAEVYCSVYRNQYRLPIVVARPFAFIGPYQSLKKHWAVNSFIRDGLFSDSIRILGDENTVRSYLYGSDMAYWILNLLTNGEVGDSYNLGSSEAVTLRELANKIVLKLNKKISVSSKSSKENYENTSFRVPNITKSNNLLQKVIITLDKAIERTINWNVYNSKNY